MSFATDISNSNNNKIVLVEIDIPIIPGILLNYTAGIWFIKFHADVVEIEDDYGITAYYPANCSIIPDKIDSCIVDSDYYTEVSSLALCLTTDSSFYYDEDDNIFYIHFADFEPRLDKIVRIGVVNGFCRTYDRYYGDTYYEPRVLTVPTITQKKDPLFFGVMSFQSGDISFINTDGFFDNYHDYNIYGQPCRIKIGLDNYEYSSFVEIFEGFIDDYSYDFNEFTIKVQDKRKNLTRKIPENTFNQTEFPYLSDDDVGKFKPVVFGFGNQYSVVCINKTQSGATNRTFLFLDNAFGTAATDNNLYINDVILDDVVVKAYIKNDEDNNLLVEVTIQSFDLNAGTFDVLSADIEDADGEIKDVFFSGMGYARITSPTTIYSTNAIDAIKFVMQTFGGVVYNDTFFNTLEISSELLNYNPNWFCGVVLDKQTELINIINLFCTSSNSMFYVYRDGRYSIKVYYSDRTAYTIPDYVWLNEPSVSYDTKNILSSLTVEWLKNNRTNSFNSKKYNTNEDEFFFKYKKYIDKKVQTQIVFNSGAFFDNVDDFAENFIDQFSEIKKVVKRKSDMSMYARNIMDFISISNHRQGQDEDYNTYEIISKTINFNDWTIDFEMREV